MNKYKIIVIFSMVMIFLYQFTGCAKNDHKEVVSNTTNKNEIINRVSCTSNKMPETSKDDKKTITIDEEMAQKKAIELVAKKLDATYNKETDEYSPAGASYNVFLMPYGFDEDGNYEVRVCPSYYPLSVFNYFFVDLNNGIITEK